MKFSVLMSVYYKENPKFLEQSLLSIYDNQTVKPNEIVLVEDGKLTVELDEVINNFKKRNKNILKSVKLETNKGLGNALKIGIEKCNNDIIARMDTDDICHPDRFKKQLIFFEKKENQFDIVGTNVAEFISNPNEIVSHKVMPSSHNDIVKYSKKRNPFCHPSVMYKKSSVIASGNYFDSYLTEDYNLWVRMIENGFKCFNIQEELVFMRINADFYKRRGGIKYLKEMLKFKFALFKKKYINFFEFLTVSLSHIIICLLPNSFRDFVYKHFLRR